MPKSGSFKNEGIPEGARLAIEAISGIFETVETPLWYLIGISAGPIFLSCVRLVERVSYMTKFGRELPETVPTFASDGKLQGCYRTHPPTFVRREYLVAQIKTTLSAKEMFVLDVGNWVDRFLDNCWSEIRDRVRVDYDEMHKSPRGD